MHNEELKKEYQNLLREKLALQKNGFMCTSCTGTITYCSENAGQLLGYSVKELVGNNFNIMQLFVPQQFDEKCKMLSKKLRRKVQGFQVFTTQLLNEDMISAQWEFLKKDSSTIRLHATVQPMLDNAATAIGFAFTFYELHKEQH